MSTALKLSVVGAVLLAGAAQAGGIEIRRTADGIPHIKADNWRDLGQGYGYAQAEDALCTLSEAFATFSGRRSLYWGEHNRPEHDSTFGRPSNIDLDVFFRAFANQQMVDAFRREQPAQLQQLIGGFAAGFNRYLAQARLERKHACVGQPWVDNISDDDIYRRMYAANIGAGYARFIPAIANAAPPGRAGRSEPAAAAPLAQLLGHGIGNQAGIGSNGLAFGGAATADRQAVLFGNPHWYWSGPDRFYQAHLSIPGTLNAAGVSFLGIPVLMLGFNDNVAWTHTVSATRRFGLFDLALTGPTAYRLDQASVAMRAQTVTVPLRGEDGKAASLTRTLYASQHGPIVDLGAQSPLLGWSAGRALALRDINAANRHSFSTFFYWNQARSLEDFVAIQRREAGLPWVNTLAIGRGDERVWFGDIGAVPNAPDALRARCATPVAQAFAGIDPKTPVLDGSRGDCDWIAAAGTAQRGALPAAEQPGLFRTDYVANMNDNHWLSNPAQPLEGFPALMGSERSAVSTRTRAGHDIAAFVLARAPLPAGELVRQLQRQVLDAPAWSAAQYKAALLGAICRQATVQVERDPLGGKALAAPETVALEQACRVLAAWDNGGDASARGAHLWDQFWARVETIPEAERFAQPFDYRRALTTPAQIRATDPRMAQALGAAVLALRAGGVALDAPRASYLYAGEGAGRVPLFGGCHEAGYFVSACVPLGEKGVTAKFVGNTYMQLVRFGPRGVEADTMLAHGLAEDGLRDTAGNTALRGYADKRWARFPFTEAEIEAGQVSKIVLRP